MAAVALPIQNLNPTVLSNPPACCVDLQKKTRVVERIQLSDPSALDREIQKFEPLKNAERNRQTLWSVAAVIVGLAIVIATTLLLACGVGLHILYPAAYSLLFVMGPLVGNAFMDGNKATEMEEGQNAMRDEKFRSFAISHFGDSLELDQLLKANEVFQNRDPSMEEEGFIQFEKQFKHPLTVERFVRIHQLYVESKAMNLSQ